MALHKSLAIGDIHIPYQWSYADATARGNATGFVASDVGKLARQLDDNTFWVLTDESPIAWVPFGSTTDSTAIHKATPAEISAMTEKTTLVGADVFVIEDSEASNAKKKVQVTNLPAGVDVTAIHKATSAEISAMTEKTTPVAADLLVIEDSAAGNAKKKLQVGNLPKNILHSSFVELTVDTTTTSGTFVDLLSTTLTTGANFLRIQATVTGDDSGNFLVNFQIMVDGVAKRAFAFYSQTKIQSAVIVYKMAVTAASHTVKVQWKVAGGTGRINVVTRSDSDHASLLVEEVVA
jgi:hypothetical protein